MNIYRYVLIFIIILVASLCFWQGNQSIKAIMDQLASIEIPSGEKGELQHIQNSIEDVVQSLSQFRTLFLAFLLICTAICSGFTLFLIRIISNFSRIKSALQGLSLQSRNLSQGLDESSKLQRANVDEMNESVSTTTTVLKKSGETILDAAEMSRSCGEASDQGGKVIQDLVKAMNTIISSNKRLEEQTTNSTEEFKEMVEIIRQVEEKTLVINDIAFQTKLLAFNASVEAARAGEMGKGFAVVSSEVAVLADRSGEAAKEITELVKSSVEKVDEIVEANSSSIMTILNSSIASVEEGRDRVNQCSDIFNTISKNINQVINANETLNDSTEEQNTCMNSINKGINAINEITSDTALVASQNLKSSEDLSVQVNNIVAMERSFNRFFSLGITPRKRFSPIVWSTRYEIKCPDMDQEHFELVKKINIFLKSLNKGHKENYLQAFEDLKNYTVYHFRSEEDLMIKMGYPDFKSHKRIHTDLLKTLGQTAAAMKKGDGFDPELLVGFLFAWLVTHILGVDGLYATYYNTEGSGRK